MQSSMQRMMGVIEVMATVDDGYLAISISDNGIGIAKEDLPTSLNLFYRGRNPDQDIMEVPG